MADFLYPTNIELRAIDQEKMARLAPDRIVFQDNLFPIRNVDDHMLAWEQKDNYIGLQQVRGLNGEPARVKKVAMNRYVVEPGVYGEFIDLDEMELTRRRQIGTFNNPVSLDDMVMEAQDQLLGRQLDRQEWVCWQLLTAGTFSVIGPTGAILHSDTFSIQTFSAGTAWATAATSTPLADFRAVQLLGPARGSNFGGAATAYMNRTTFNRLLANTNAADYGGRRTTGLSPINTQEQVNALQAGEDLPRIVVYDEGYFDSAGTFTRFIPNAKVVIVGARPAGQSLGEFRFTRNVNNPNMEPGPYLQVVDSLEDGPPRRVDVHRGFNGGPVLYFAGSILVMSV